MNVPSLIPGPAAEAAESRSKSLPPGVVFQTWWPLAASWLLMSIELSLVSAVIARLPNPETDLAAYGGVVFPLALIIEAPIIMLLAASTALSRDWASFLKLRRYMMAAGAALTLLHLAVAFTPLYDFVVVRLIGAPPEIVEPARLGLRILTPWSWAIAYRRFHQGVLIRFGHSTVVGLGTVVRLTADALVLAAGSLLGGAPGIAVGSAAVATGVVSEAVYTGLRARPVLRNEVRLAPASPHPLDFASFLGFYVPLAMTSLLLLLVQPMGSAALSRMPRALESLAVWPVVSGLIFMSRSLGVAYNEVVVALLDRPAAVATLRRFAFALAAATSVALLVFAASPLAEFWFRQVSGLRPALASLAHSALWLALPMPGLTAIQSWYQGMLVHRRRTRAITVSMALFLLAAGLVLAAGVAQGGVPGLYIVWLAFSAGAFAQTAWLFLRSRSALRALLAEGGAAQDLHAAPALAD